jgi:hypothetical protein
MLTQRLHGLLIVKEHYDASSAARAMMTGFGTVGAFGVRNLILRA